MKPIKLEPNVTVKPKGGREMLSEVITRLEEMPKQGASYDEKGRHGWRNPIRTDTGSLLTNLVRIKQPLLILEIGTAYGLSTCYLGQGKPDARIVTIEWDEEVAKEAQANLNVAGLYARVMHGDAMEVIRKVPGQFDVVFFDANKDGYLEQFMLLQERRLLAPKCLILADNVIDRQKECQDFLDHMKRYDAVIVPTECGLLVASLG